MRIKLSFNPFVPKPYTDLRDQYMERRDTLKRIIRSLKKMSAGPYQVDLKFGSLKRFEMQYKIANGDDFTLFNLYRENKTAVGFD